jgi:type IV pilus assembly protein PilW
MKNRKENGLTLVELLIALVLSLVIIAGIVQVFLANREAYNISESLIRVQENGRFAMNFLSTAIRQSGNYGCLPDVDPMVDNIQTQFAAEIPDINTIQTNAFVGIGNTADGAAGAAGEFPAPDSLTLMVSTDNTARVTGVITYPHTLSVGAGAVFEENDYVLISNCQVADFVKLGNGSSATQIVDATAGMRTDFFTLGNMVTNVTEVQFINYFVEDDVLHTRFVNTATGAVVEQELLNGIENIQYSFGVDTNGDFVVDYFDDITAVDAEGDILNIVAVKIFVLAVSGGDGDTAQVVSEEQTLTMNEVVATMPEGDLRLRRVFETTVSLRNRMN